MIHRNIPLRWALLALALLSPAAPAQTKDAPPDSQARETTKMSVKDQAARAAALASRALEAFAHEQYEESEQLLREQLKLQPDNFVIDYNLASCRARLNDPDGAVELLYDAVDRGFCDVYQLRRDPVLDPLRDRPKFKDLLAGWDAILIARRDANLAGNRQNFRDGYAESLDDRLRLAYLSAFDPRAFEQARTEVTRVADWASQSLMPDILDPKAAGDDAWVVVVLPNRRDFTRWAVSLYGEGAVRGTSMIAGSYEHDAKRLVSMDLGATLRHEFMHVLHWRHMTRLGQSHAIWIMEGLCSLLEDCDVDAAGRLTPTISWRTNIVKRMEQIGSIMPVDKLAALSQEKFTGTRPLAMYAQARSFFLYLLQKGKLKEWYQDYTTHFAEDATGVQSLERVLGMNAKDITRDFRLWIRSLPMVPEQVQPGMASLGMDIESGTGEGPVIIGIDVSRRNAVDGLRAGDVITAIDHRPVRDIAELVRILGLYKPGDAVEIDYRRVKLYKTAHVTLVEAK